GQVQRYRRKQDQYGQPPDIAYYEGRHAAKDGLRTDAGQQAAQHKHIHAERRRDEADLGDHDHDDAEPDQVEPQTLHQRVEHRHGQQDHRHAFQHAAQHDVDAANGEDHGERAQVIALHQFEQ